MFAILLVYLSYSMEKDLLLPVLYVSVLLDFQGANSFFGRYMQLSTEKNTTKIITEAEIRPCVPLKIKEPLVNAAESAIMANAQGVSV